MKKTFILFLLLISISVTVSAKHYTVDEITYNIPDNYIVVLPNTKFAPELEYYGGNLKLLQQDMKRKNVKLYAFDPKTMLNILIVSVKNESSQKTWDSKIFSKLKTNSQQYNNFIASFEKQVQAKIINSNIENINGINFFVAESFNNQPLLFQRHYTSIVNGYSIGVNANSQVPFPNKDIRNIVESITYTQKENPNNSFFKFTGNATNAAARGFIQGLAFSIIIAIGAFLYSKFKKK